MLSSDYDFSKISSQIPIKRVDSVLQEILGNRIAKS